MSNFNRDYELEIRQLKNSIGSNSSDGDVSPLTSRKVSLAENKQAIAEHQQNDFASHYRHQSQPLSQYPKNTSPLISPGVSASQNSSPQSSPYRNKLSLGGNSTISPSATTASSPTNPSFNQVSSSYKGFHHAGKSETIPPLAHPIKPKHKKSFFGKFINSIKDEKEKRKSDASSIYSDNGGSSNSARSSVSKPLSRLSSVGGGLREQFGFTALSNHHNKNRVSSESQSPDRQQSSRSSESNRTPNNEHSQITTVTSKLENLGNPAVEQSVVALNLNDLNDMSGIVASPEPTSDESNDIDNVNTDDTTIPDDVKPQQLQQPQKQKQKQHPYSTLQPTRKETWAAPESWDVKNEKLVSKNQNNVNGEQDDDENDDDEYVVRKPYTVTQVVDDQALSSKNYHIRIFAEDDDFTSTLKRPYHENVDEMIKFLKGRYQLNGDYKLSLRVGKVTKKLEYNQKPIKIQTNLLLLSGYLEDDKLDEVGRYDLSHLFKFILHHDVLKQLTPIEEENINRDLVHVNLKSKDLQKIPALCYSSKVQSLDVSNNGDISLPIDFFQTADSQLSSLRMVNIRTKVFPPNIVFAKELVSLDLERNFISSLPLHISFLKNLSILNLSCNKISTLPKLPSSLKILDISSNEFVTYPESVNELTTLLQLDLSYNKLTVLPQSINNLKSVKKINISSNYLTYVDINLSNLRTLNLRHNDITEIHLHDGNIENLYLTNNIISNITDPLTSLKTLDLKKNPITQLNLLTNNLASLNLSKAKLTSLPQIILTLTKLEKLELSQNALRELPNLSTLSNLKELVVFSNNLEKLPDFKPLTKLKNVDLHDNNLKSISDFSFIESVNISSNLISELPSANSNTIVHLRASDNQLDENSLYVIKNFVNLKILSLAYNKIIEIPSGTLSSLTNIDQLYLSGNSLTGLPDDFDKLLSLRVLCLNGNRFRSLPSDLSNIDGLEIVDVGSNELRYNTSNSKYEWNWKNNLNLRYLNLSGNKKLEVTEDMNLPKLRLLGLMDLTITTQSIPDESINIRVRTTPTSLGSMSYGISDRVVKHIVARDSVFEKIDDGILIGLFDGIHSGKISHIIREQFHKIFEIELQKSDVITALRITFLQLNTLINHADLNSEDGLTGSTVTVVYIKGNKIYTANIGDTMAMLAKPDGSFDFLSVNHQPSSPTEFDRIRSSGGFVSSNDKVDGVSQVSRAAGFMDLLPHIHTGPDISEASFHDEVLVVGTKELFEYLPTKTIGDIVRESDNPMLTAEKLRDYAIAYGCSSKVCAIVLTKKKAKKKSIPLTRQVVEDSNLRRLNPEIQPPVGEIAMVFTDIKNSTLLWENYPLAMRSAIRTHNDIMRRQLHIVGGYEVKTEGDAFMVSFPTITSAMIWCFNVQQQLLQEDWPAEILQSQEGHEFKDENGQVIYKGLSVRMGIHWGTPVCEPDIITRRMDYFGPMVNKTARVCAVADGGEITLTLDCLNEFKRIEAAYNLTQTGVPIPDAFGNGEISENLFTEFEILSNVKWRYEPLGKVQLKGLETEEEITIIFPKQLETRWKFQKKADLTADDVNRLREITLKLSLLSAQIFNTPTDASNIKRSDHLDKQFFEVFISKIEHIVAMLALRDNTVGLFGSDMNIFELVEEVTALYAKFQQKALN